MFGSSNRTGMARKRLRRGSGGFGSTGAKTISLPYHKSRRATTFGQAKALILAHFEAARAFSALQIGDHGFAGDRGLSLRYQRASASGR